MELKLCSTCIIFFAACTISQGKHFDEESNASLSTARDETRDGFFMEDSEPTVAQLLHERTYCFSFWPKVCAHSNHFSNCIIF